MRSETNVPAFQTGWTEQEAALDALAAKAMRDLDYLGELTPNWVPESEGVAHDVLVVGGGQSGIAVAFQLRRVGIGRVRVIDAAQAGREGVWRGIARMQTLRSTKILPGPELGIAALSFRAWYETRFGRDAYEALLRCDREHWADYIDWYRSAIGMKVENDTVLDQIAPAEGGLLRVLTRRGGKSESSLVRKIVLATGMAGCGRPSVPALFAGLPEDAFAHTDQVIDFERLRGKRVGVLGAASSAFDAAATALEAGASEVRLFSRHPDLVRVTTIKGMAYAGALDHFHQLPDAVRWSLMSYFTRRSAGPIADTVRRATKHANFHLHLGRDWGDLRFDEAATPAMTVQAGSEVFSFDFVIAGTGYAMDLGARPELRGFADQTALWSDRFVPPPDEAAPTLGTYPYLGEGFEFLEKTPGEAPFLKNIHCFNYAASVSHGRAVGEIASLKHGTPRLVATIGRDLFLADTDRHLQRLKSFNTPDLSGDEYAAASTRIVSERADAEPSSL